MVVINMNSIQNQLIKHGLVNQDRFDNAAKMSKTSKDRFNEKFIRKHNSMMSDHERAVLDFKLDKCDLANVEMGYHAHDRFEEYDVNSHFTVEEMIATIHDGDIIDYTRDIRNRPIERFLMRNHSGDKHRVIIVEHEKALNKWSVITGWWNDSHNNHPNLDMSIYTDFNVLDCFDK